MNNPKAYTAILLALIVEAGVMPEGKAKHIERKLEAIGTVKLEDITVDLLLKTIRS